VSHDDFGFERVRGLPSALPEGEVLLWQGVPRWRSLAVRAYHVRKIAVYFAALALCRIGFGIGAGHAWPAILLSSAFVMSLGGVAIGVLSLLAYLNGNSTVYSITNRRILLRHGVAVPLTMNIPFPLIESADLSTYPDATGDIALRLIRQQRVGYLITWPHLRPGRLTHPQPSFRALIDAQRAAQILASALSDEAGPNAARVAPSPAPRGAVGRPRTAAA